MLKITNSVIMGGGIGAGTQLQEPANWEPERMQHFTDGCSLTRHFTPLGVWYIYYCPLGGPLVRVALGHCILIWMTWVDNWRPWGSPPLFDAESEHTCVVTS